MLWVLRINQWCIISKTPLPISDRTTCNRRYICKTHWRTFALRRIYKICCRVWMNLNSMHNRINTTLRGFCIKYALISACSWIGMCKRRSLIIYGSVSVYIPRPPCYCTTKCIAIIRKIKCYSIAIVRR